MAEQSNGTTGSSIIPLMMAAGSGGLLALAFPKFNLLPLGMVALLPLLIFIAREPSGWKRFVGGFLGGVIFFTATCYWLYLVQVEYGSLPPLQAAGVLLLLVLFMALYWGVFSWLAGRCWQLSWGPAIIPLLWVAVEYARTRILTGFPWLLSGYLFTDYFSLARLARWTGIYGLSYLSLAFPVAVLWAFFKPSKLSTLHLLLVLALTTGLALYPVEGNSPGDQRAFLVQANVPQHVAFEPWDSKSQEPLFRRLDKLTLENVPEQDPPALVVWPEMPAHFYFNDDGFTRPYVERLARQTNSYFIVGAVTFVPGSNQDKALNSAILLSPSGQVVSQYDKLHLVPFGEYVPWREHLGFASSLTAEVSDFTAGQDVTVSDIPGGKLASLICYEAIFPDLVRRFVQQGAGVLVNISNDGWFGDTAARYQHLLQVRMRAIENDRYILRATNTGITTVIAPDGTLAAHIPTDAPGVLKASWSFKTTQTFYTQHGDVFALSCTVIALLACLISFIKPSGGNGGSRRGAGRKAGKKGK